MYFTLANLPKYFQNSYVLETRLADLKKFMLTVMMTAYRKIEPKIISCKEYKDFSNDRFRSNVTDEVSQLSIKKNVDEFSWVLESLL